MIKIKNNVVIIRSNPVNPDSRVEKEANSLIKAGFNVQILAWDRTSKYSSKVSYLKLKNSNPKITRFGIKASFGEGFKNLKAFLLFQLRVFKWLITHRKEYTIIHACDFDTAFISKIAASILKKKLVFDIFDYLSTNPKSFFQKFIKKIEDRIINTSDAVIICSENRQNQIKNTKPKKLAIIHNSPDKNIINDNENNSIMTNNIKIVYVGILQDNRFLKEMTKCIINMKNIEFHVGGFGKYEEYFEEVSSRYDNIYYYGKLSYEETLLLEKKCHIMTAIYDPAIGNHFYAAPNKFYEALMLGKPLIMVKNTGMSQIIDKYNIGVLMDYSEEGFVDAINKLINKKIQWPIIEKTMKSLYEEKYSWSIMEDRLVNLYKEL